MKLYCQIGNVSLLLSNVIHQLPRNSQLSQANISFSLNSRTELGLATGQLVDEIEV